MGKLKHNRKYKKLMKEMDKVLLSEGGSEEVKELIDFTKTKLEESAFDVYDAKSFLRENLEAYFTQFNTAERKFYYKVNDDGIWFLPFVGVMFIAFVALVTYFSMK